jgi:hypothetical protein
MDLRFFCLALKGAGRRPQHAENWAERMCSSQTAKPREEPCTCFSNYQLGSFEDISRVGAYNNGIALFQYYCQRLWQHLPIIMINFMFVVTFIPLILIGPFITFFFDTVSTHGTGRLLNEEWVRIWKEVAFIEFRY